MDDLVTQIQMYYPRIYMSCHTDHVKAKTSSDKISSRDSAILAHLLDDYFQHPKILSKHLGISQSTLSEALHNLVSLGYLSFESDESDGRRTRFKLTDVGIAAMKNNSVLDSNRVKAILEKIAPEERLKVVEGLKILADAATRI